MKRLENLIGNLIASKIGVHVFFCLLFVLLFAIPVLLSENTGIGFPALLTCLFILSCTYAGRWSGKLWLSGGIRVPFVRSLLLSVLILSATGATGAAWLFRGSIPHYFVQYLAVCFPMVVLFVFLGLSIALVRTSILKQLNEARIGEEQKESELRLLLSKLSPHFLFNTLNNIYGISITQHQRVPQLLLKLSELLRYSIYETGVRFIPLKNELLYIHNYIDFEKIHCGDKLVLETELDDIYDSHLEIPPMLLIVFVENAFKHSKNTRDPTIFIAISLHIRAGWIHFTIRNSYYQEIDTQTSLKDSSGIGLSHTIKRLGLIYGNNYVYDAKKENGIYTVDLCLKATEI